MDLSSQSQPTHIVSTQAQSEQLSLIEMAYIAMNRFTYGADKKSVKKLRNVSKASQISEWLIGQIKPYKPKENNWTSEQAIKAFYQIKQKERQTKQMMANTMSSDESATLQLKSSRRQIVSKARRMAEQTALLSINSDIPLQSRLLDFFSNHFSVTRGNLALTLLAPTMEVEAIAPYLGGNFGDMLVAVTKHPAMIFYLNNEKSIGPDSKLGKRRLKKKRGNPRGLNENLAREILELHTMGVGSAYTQTDVIELAKAITGWSIGSIKRDEHPGFIFREQTHEPGTRVILNKQYRSDGISQGERILLDLAIHPDTAKHVSYKLAQHFIADIPPTELVHAMQSTWLDSKGDIPSVLTTLIQHPTSWQRQSQKLKTPREFVISSCRACGVSAPRPDLFQTLEILGHGFFNAGSPAGYPDEERAWLGASALNSRIEWASHFASNVTTKSRKGKQDAATDPRAISQLALGPLLSSDTFEHIARAESKDQSLALFLMSPEFQRR